MTVLTIGLRAFLEIIRVVSFKNWVRLQTAIVSDLSEILLSVAINLIVLMLIYFLVYGAFSANKTLGVFAIRTEIAFCRTSR